MNPYRAGVSCHVTLELEAQRMLHQQAIRLSFKKGNILSILSQFWLL